MALSATTTITQEYASIDINEKSSKFTSGTNNHGKEYGKVLTKSILKGRVDAIDTDTCGAGDEDAFFVADMGEVYRQHLRWKMNLKRVKPHYGAFLFNSIPIIGTHTNIHQLSNATRIRRSFVCLRVSALVLTVHPRQKSNRSSISVSILPGLSTLSHARPSHMFASQLSVGSSK